MARLDQRKRGPRRRTGGPGLDLRLCRELLATADLWDGSRLSACRSREQWALRNLVERCPRFFPDFDPTDAELEPLWSAVGEDLTRAHAEHRPGTRPWGWWKWNAPEARRETTRKVRSALSGETFTVPDLESEPDYLDRLGLLLPAEAEALAALPDQVTEAFARPSRVPA